MHVTQPDPLSRLLKGTSVGKERSQSHFAATRGHGLPDKDVPILAAAIAQGADLLVTGDRRDFGHLYGYSPGEVEVIGLAGVTLQRGAAQPSKPSAKITSVGP